MPRHVLTLFDIPPKAAAAIIERARALKAGAPSSALSGKFVVLIFSKASTRTRVSFEIGIRQLGGQSLLMTPAESQLGRSEPLEDMVRVLSRYADALVVRTFGQNVVETLAQAGSIPVINALTDDYHPCQILADVLTMRERVEDLSRVTAAWVGDGNNMAHSLINGSALFGYTLRLACPEGYQPRAGIVEKARSRGARIELFTDPAEAVRGAQFIHTDVWASMGQESEQELRARAFAGFQVNDRLLSLAAPGCKVMHCLPAHRGEEITAEVLEGPASIVFDQAENRLHAQKALLEWVFEAI